VWRRAGRRRGFRTHALRRGRCAPRVRGKDGIRVQRHLARVFRKHPRRVSAAALAPRAPRAPPLDARGSWGMSRGSSSWPRQVLCGCGDANTPKPRFLRSHNLQFFLLSQLASTLADLVAEAVLRLRTSRARASFPDHESRRSREPGVASRVADVAVLRRPRWELGRRSAQGETRARRRRAERTKLRSQTSSTPNARARSPPAFPPLPLFPTDRS
jgi:hypothetical protein